jgi:hypothetical protein
VTALKTPAEISRSHARRITIAALGLDRPRPRGRVGPARIAEVIRRLGLLQIDSINVVVPAHYQVLYSRLGPYRKEHLDDLVFKKRSFTERWAREASIVPVEVWPLVCRGMKRKDRRTRHWEAFISRHRSYFDRVLEVVREKGPLTSRELPDPEGGRGKKGFWGWDIPKAALEAHFFAGDVAIANRIQPGLARVYDLAERVVPEEHLRRRFDEETSQRELVLRAASSLGIAVASDLGDYYRLSTREVRQRADELVESGKLRAIRVEGWREKAYLHPEARIPRKTGAASLVSPFDPLVWCRSRTARLFEFNYTLEIWVPREKRKWGYYVFPFLLGDRLVARVDLKADRKERRLLVLAAYPERDIDQGAVAAALAIELRTFASWLDLDAVKVARKGRLARDLGAAVRAGSG